MIASSSACRSSASKMITGTSCNPARCAARLVEGFFAEIPTRVAWIGAEKFDRNFLLAARARGGGERLLAAEQGGKTAPEPRRRFFGGFTGFHKPVPKTRIVPWIRTIYTLFT